MNSPTTAVINARQPSPHHNHPRFVLADCHAFSLCPSLNRPVPEPSPEVPRRPLVFAIDACLARRVVFLSQGSHWIGMVFPWILILHRAAEAFGPYRILR